MQTKEFSELMAFAAVASARSFRRGAASLNLRPSTLSHLLRSLEERLGVKLLARTTRSVAPTAAGAALLAEISPALATLDAAIEATNAYREKPQGSVRLSVPQNAASSIFAPRLAAFIEAFPSVTLEISVNDAFVDIVRDDFTAGVRLGEHIGAGMSAVPIGVTCAAAVVATPGYWADHGRPGIPNDLLDHRCIGRRFATGLGIYRWRFARGAEEIEVACKGPLILDSEPLMRLAALDGAGVAFLAEADVADDIAGKRLERVLADWCPPTFSYCLYHPSHALADASLKAVIDFFGNATTTVEDPTVSSIGRS